MSTNSQKEHLLLTIWDPEPTDTINLIKQKHPNIEVTFVACNDTNNFADPLSLGDAVPKDVWQRTTILVTLFALPRSIDMVPNLKHIHVFSAGIDHFATHPILTSSTIPLSTSTGIAAPPIAEHIVMTLLSLTTQLPRQLTWQKDRHWGPKAPFLASPGDWVNKTVGIAGYGASGRHAGRILSALGARIHAYTSTPRETPSQRRDTNYHVPNTGDPTGTYPTAWFGGTSKPSLHAFLASGLHALIICLPLTPKTKHLFSAEEFALLQRTSPYSPSTFDPDGPEGPTRSGAFIVNTARGAILDQSALVDALKRKIIRGAALDATDPEPLPVDSELWGLDNCIITPHTSALGSEYPVRCFELLMENLDRLQRGERVWNLVERGRGY